MEFSDVAAVGAVYEIRQARVADMLYLDKMWVNQFHTHRSYWKVNNMSGGPQIPTGKGVSS